MEKNNTKKTETKVNRYTILDAELKRLSAELKAKKKEMVENIRKLEAEYRAFRKEVYAPARSAAWDTFKSTKVVGTKKTDVVAAEKPAKKSTKKTAKKSTKKVAADVACVVVDTEVAE
jgi:uncharacterized protein (UPF0335 family)